MKFVMLNVWRVGWWAGAVACFPALTVAHAAAADSANAPATVADRANVIYVAFAYQF